MLRAQGEEVARVEAALGSPQRPMDRRALGRKVESLAGGAQLTEALSDPERPAAELLALVE